MKRFQGKGVKKNLSSDSLRIRRIGTIGGTVAATLGLAALLIFQKTSYLVTRIIDGDTFETKEKQLVRINGIQSPEKGLCYADNCHAKTRDPDRQQKKYISKLYIWTNTEEWSAMYIFLTVHRLRII